MVVRQQNLDHAAPTFSEWLARATESPSKAEIERRTRLAVRARALRESIGPIDIRADELKRQARLESGEIG
jgi:hypothetical protein